MRFRYLWGRLPLLLAAGGTAAGLLFLAIYLPRLLAPVALLERAFSLAAALAVIGTERVEEFKTGKLFLLFLPWLGAILCFFFLPRPAPRTPLSATDASSEDFFLPAAAGKIEYFTTGEELYPRLLADLAGAKRRIFLEYYIIAGGVFWDSVYAVLRERAACGVDVKLIYDDFGCALTRRRAFVRELRAHGIGAARFRALRLARGAGKRDHRKIAVIDGAVYTGGINLADEYIGKKVRFGHWKDTAVRAEGGIADRFADLFSEHFSRADGGQPSRGGKEDFFSGSVPCLAVADGADGEERRGAPFLPYLIGRAQKSLFLFTPYLAPDGATRDALLFAARRGVDVRLMIPHIPDKKWVFFLTRSYARELAAGGVKVREYTAGFLHAKSVVSDGAEAFVSSYNLDFRSLYLQAECGLYAEDPSLAAAVERDFLSCFAQGTPLPPASLPARALGKIARLFSPLI